MNAKYIISVARKLGAVIFLTWEDIRDVKPKMIMTLVASLAIVFEKGSSEEMPNIYDTETTKN